MPRKAYLYMRFSSAEQAKGDSLERQRSLAEEYVKRHPEKDLELDEELQFVDEGISSFGGQNLQPGRGLHRFLQCVEDGRVAPGSTLMVESLDRLSRQQVIQSQRLLLDILLRGVSVITTSPAESREYDGRSGLQDLIIALAGMERANRESEIKSQRVRSAWKRKKERAPIAKLTSRGPSWLRLSPDRTAFSIVEEKAAVIRRIFDLAETLGQASIVRILNNEGVPPLARGSRGWQESSIAKILTSPAVIGVYQPHELATGEKGTRRIPDGPAVEGYYPAIIDQDLFYRVQAVRSSRKQSGAGRKGENYTNIFGGIAKCASCGAAMSVVDKGSEPKGGQYFVCSAARRGAGCSYRAVRYKNCESGFLMYCQRVDVSDILPGVGGKSKAAELRKRQATLRGEVEQKLSVIDRIVASIDSNGGHVPKAIQKQLTGYGARIECVEQELAKVADELAALDNEQYQAFGMRASFNELLAKLRVVEGEERYVLRSKLHVVLRAAIQCIEVGPADPEMQNAVSRLARSERASLLSKHPELEDRWKALGVKAYPPLKGSLSSFKVFYKNGNTYELFIDSNLAVAGIMTYNGEAIAAAKKSGQWSDSHAELHLTYGYGSVQAGQKPVRGPGGKFVASRTKAPKSARS